VQAGGTVTFATNGSIVLTDTITIYNDVVLDGTGHAVTISGGGTVRIFELPGGFHLTLRNLTISNASFEGSGGAIFSQGFLNVENCQFASNTATYLFGGAIYSAGVLTVSNSIFIGNSSKALISGEVAAGGAIFNDGGWLEMVDSVFTANSAIGGPGNGLPACRDCPSPPAYSGSGYGGAIYSSGGTVVASNLLVARNSAISPTPAFSSPSGNYGGSATGGGVCVEAGTASFANTILSNNLAYVESGFQSTTPAAGGSVYNAGSMVLSNCAILDSVATNGSTEDATGGGGYNSGAMLVYGSVISDNSVGSAAIPGQGGGIYNAGSAQFIGCTVSNNMARGGSGGGIANSGMTSVSNLMVVCSGASGTMWVGIGIYNSGVFECDSNSFLTGFPSGSPGVSFEWELNGTNIQGTVSNALNLGIVQFASNGTYSLLVSNSSGTAINFDEVLNQTATNAPTFALQPVGEITNIGTTVQFQAVATGFPAPSYQWQFNGAYLAGATTSELTLIGTTANEAGSYSILASNVFGAVTSQIAVLVLEQTNLTSVIEVQPRNQVVLAGTNVVFSVTSPPAGTTYQWMKNGAALPAQTNATLDLTNVSASDDGAFSLALRSPGGTLTGGSAFLSVITGPPVIIAQPQAASLGNGGPAVLSVGVAGGGTVNPPGVASGTLQLWLKADAGAVVTTSGDMVRWQDQSGNKNDAIQLNTNEQPSIVYPASLGGLAAIRFSGAQNLPQGEYLTGTGTVGVLGDMTSFMVYDVSTSAIPEQVAFFIGVPGSQNGGRGDYLASGEMSFATWVSSYNSGYPVPTNAYRIWSDRISGNQTQLEFFDDTLDTASNFVLVFSPHAPPGAGYYVGGLDPAVQYVETGRNFAGDIAELMVYDGALSDSDRLAVLNYLKQKYYQVNPPGLSYQWQCNGTNVVGATNASLIFAAGQPSQTGVYDVVVSNLFGAVVSSNATLSVSPSSRVVSVLDESSLALALEEGGQITFTSDGTILMSNTITLDSDAIIDGTGHNVTLSGGGGSGLFNVPAGRHLTLRNLTLANAVASAIVSQGDLDSENCTFTNNFGGYGGAIHNTGLLTVTKTLFANNSANEVSPSLGGAIFNDGGTVSLGGVTFLSNSASVGGALFSSNGVLFAINVQAVSNMAGLAMGGAMCIIGGTATVSNGFFFQNAALGYPGNTTFNGPGVSSYPGGGAEGGAIFNSGTTILAQCVILQNTAIGGVAANSEFGPGNGQGGAIWNSNDMQIFNSIISSNIAQGGMDGNNSGSAQGEGGGLYNFGVAHIFSSTLSDNVSAGGFVVYDGDPFYGTSYGLGLGGGIANAGLIQVLGATLSNNFTTGLGNYGEEIYNTGTFLTDSNTIVMANSAGTPPLTYDWQFDGTNIAGATSSIINLTNVQFNNAGTYSLLISNSSGLVTNFDEILNQPVTNAPALVLQPLSEVTNLGSTVEFEAAATGFPAPTYQWLFDGTNIAGATTSALILTNVLQNQSGTYTVIATNYLGSSTSQQAILTVNGTILLTGIDLGTAGFSITGEGMPGTNIIIEVSTNLIDWQPLQTNPSPFTFIDTNAPASRFRFYRAVLAH
jgi:predicted outer membrane repeat protein